MLSIFVSYSRDDKNKINSIVSDIEALGYNVWYDNELSGGQDWWDQILKQIRSIDIFVFLVSQKSMDSTPCKREYNYASALRKPIIPLQIDEEVSTNLLPKELSRIQIVNYLNPNRESGFRLARAFTSITSFPPLPSPLPEPPEVPLSYIGNVSSQVNSERDLTFQEQSSLLIEIKQFTRDKELGNDAGKLLVKFRKRRDLYARIAEEADDILQQLVKEKPDNPVYKQDLLESVKKPKSTKYHSIIKQSSIGTGIGIAWTLFYYFGLGGYHDTRDWQILMVMCPIAGAISAPISGFKKNGIITILFFSAIVATFFYIMSGSSDWALPRACILGVSSGSIVGATVFFIINRLTRKQRDI